jgi:predicted metal-dependent peptidase
LPFAIAKLEKLAVEEIYEILIKNAVVIQLPNPDLLAATPGDCPQESGEDCGSLAGAKKAEMETHWRNALQQAMVVARSNSQQGHIPSGLKRELGALNQAQLDWRSYLWRYLVQTPTDFSGFDRRFVGRGLYLEALQGESVQVFVAIDTSGSIGHSELRMFLSEVAGILAAYPHLECQLYYADADAYGPYPLDPNSEIPDPVGGGGTSFIPFFNKVQENWDWQSSGVCVYLTDGYGFFPRESPSLPVLWVVTPGGMDLNRFPFGEAVRLLSV